MPAGSQIRKIVWQPNPGPQTKIFSCPADLVLYGGAKGGGKSEAMLPWAAHGYDKDGYRAIIFRRTFPELERHIIDRSKRLFTGIGKYDDKRHRWRFPTPANPGGRVSVGGEATLEFGYLEQEDDVHKYSGAEYARIGFDESTFFSENQVRLMLTCLRSPVEGVKRQALLGANPIGPGFGWHKLMFIKDREAGELYGDAKWPSDQKSVGLTTCFIPARVWDNPVLLKRDPDYPTRLESQYGSITQALLHGSWEQALYLALDIDPEVHFIEPFELPKWARRFMAIDWGVTDTAACVWMASVGGEVFAYRDHCRPGKEIVPYAEEVVERMRDEYGNIEEVDFCVLSHECFARRGYSLGNTQADQFLQVFQKANIPLVKSDKDPEGRLLLAREYVRTGGLPIVMESNILDFQYWSERIRKEGAKAADEYIRLSGTGNHGPLPKLKIFKQSGNMGCPALMKTLPLLVVDQNHPRKIAEGQEDDPFDALTYGLKGFVGGVNIPLEEYYKAQIGDQVPDSGFAAELAMQEAQRQMNEQQAGGIGGAIPWRGRRPKFRR